MRRRRRVSLGRFLRRAGWGISVLGGTMSMAAGIFAAGAAARLRLWRLSRLVWVLPVFWTAGGFAGVFRATRRLDQALSGDREDRGAAGRRQ